MAKNTSIVRRTESAIDDFRDLWRRRKGVSILVAVVLLLPTTSIVLYDRFITIPKLEAKIESRDSEVSQLRDRLSNEERLRDKAEASLERFQLLAERKLPDVPKDQRLDKLLEKMDQTLLRLHEATQRFELQTKPPGSTERKISSETADRLQKLLSNMKPIKISVTSILGDSESFLLANQIKDLFQDVGWPVDGVSQAIFTKPVMGLVVRVSEVPTAKIQEALALLFDEFGYERVADKTSEVPSGAIQIVVGSRP